MKSALSRALATAALVVAWGLPASAQQANPVCTRLETQLQNFDRGGGADQPRAEQIRRYQEAAGNQQAEIERQQTLARRMGCGNSGFFVLFSNEPAQCGPQNAKISQMRANLEKINSDLATLERGSDDRGGQRQAILMALAQNNCGPQYQAAAQPARSGGFLESLFGNRSPVFGGGDGSNVAGGGYRTLCVRTCDGYFYPISFSTSPDRFADDEKACRASCPASEAMLFAHRNPGEDVSQAVSTGGQLYSSLPNAFRFRQAFDSACSCRRPGESWANTMRGVEENIEAGDIVVNEQRARQLSAPQRDAQGRPIPVPPAPRTTASTRPVTPAAAQPPAPAAEEAKSEAAAPATPVKPDPNRQIRAVGPTFLPAR